ncbi:endonuclease-reverse transcriptase [Plakobranchus ocellatus]|uniref:Endonuclease-reverse transcriptase n=1 Tax=Plakobranchus ocellatus TaxID=259542 RepID=A0AAV4CGW5_9GAST|nr:endonuclease-reverse transcriptase [Plakobranchus ocellatus]
MVQAGGEATIDMLLLICNKILQTGVWPKPWTQSLVITPPKKGNLKLSQNYRTISLISHPSKVMQKVILNRRKPEAEKIIAEEQAGFRPGRSTVEQICNVRIIIIIRCLAPWRWRSCPSSSLDPRIPTMRPSLSLSPSKKSCHPGFSLFVFLCSSSPPFFRL